MIAGNERAPIESAPVARPFRLTLIRPVWIFVADALDLDDHPVAHRRLAA